MTPPANIVRLALWQKLLQRDALHTLAITLLACLASGGLLYVFYVARCVWIATTSGVNCRHAVVVLLFGKRLHGGAPDADYAARIDRVHALLARGGIERVLLLGGRSSGPGETTSEAEAALARLRARGVADDVELVLEDASSDTLQNLRNARTLLAERPPAPVALVSSRYHLARCALLARNHGFEVELCAAEARLQFDRRLPLRLLLEGGCLMWIDIGTRWARLLRDRRMLDQVT